MAGKNDAFDPFHEVLYRVVQAKLTEIGIDARSLADKLGIHYRLLMFWLSGQRKIPAEIIPRLCVILKNHALLDALEREAGRIAFHLPPVSQLPRMDDFEAVQKLVQEVGGALKSLGDTLEDGVVTTQELKVTLPELDDVIRECAKLKHFLEQRHYSRSASKRRSSPAGSC